MVPYVTNDGGIDMSTLEKAGLAFKVVCSLVFSVMLAGLPGTAAAQATSGSINFCDGNYDNATPQTSGLFTDIRHGNGINADTKNCVLNITGSAGSAGDMWITLLDAPGGTTPPPTFSCVEIEASVKIHQFANRKAVGFVTNYDPGTGKGLFLGLTDNGNSDAMTLSTFDATTGKLTGTVANASLGSKIRENEWYILVLEICTDADSVSGFGGLRTDSVTHVLPFDEDLPDGISPSGLIGIAGQAKSAIVDSSVADFIWQP
jgi:hypothetical protein